MTRFPQNSLPQGQALAAIWNGDFRFPKRTHWEPAPSHSLRDKGRSCGGWGGPGLALRKIFPAASSGFGLPLLPSRLPALGSGPFLLITHLVASPGLAPEATVDFPGQKSP